eukprot:scaffold2752_cov179-Ochromonas_danica.AAC.6
MVRHQVGGPGNGLPMMKNGFSLSEREVSCALFPKEKGLETYHHLMALRSSKKAVAKDFAYSDTDTDTDRGRGDDLTSNKLGREVADTSVTKPKEPVTFQKVATRSITALFLALLYFSILMSGHFYCILAVALTQWHGLAYGLFASVVAPFGGFFASAIKRAYNKKDFDSFMPGHGGMMDRMDCQLVMITFNSFYYAHFIANRVGGVDYILALAARMPAEQQLVLWKQLGEALGLSNNTISAAVSGSLQG